MNKKKKLLIYLFLVVILAISIMFAISNIQECVGYSQTIAKSIEYTNSTGLEDPLLETWKSYLTKFAIYSSCGILSGILSLIIAYFIYVIDDIKNAIFLVSQIHTCRIEAKQNQAELRKQERIEKLEKELKELKND